MAQQEIPQIQLDYAFSMRINNSGRIDFQGEMRNRVYEQVTGGEIWGPRLDGRVVPMSGADYASRAMMDAHMMLQASDGTFIYMNLLGYEHEDTDDGVDYFRVAPYFDTPAGPHAWLAKTVFIGRGERHTNPNHVIFHFHALA